LTYEHAYYLDYQNLRPQYLADFLAHLVNWDFVASQVPGRLDLEYDLSDF